MRYDPTERWPPSRAELEEELVGCDAIVVAEHREPVPIIGTRGIPVAMLPDGLCIIHVAGTVDVSAIASRGLRKYPDNDVPFGRMTVTTGYVGPRPVIDLHAGGLRAGADAVRAFKHSGNATESEAAAEHFGYALSL